MDNSPELRALRARFDAACSRFGWTRATLEQLRARRVPCAESVSAGNECVSPAPRLAALDCCTPPEFAIAALPRTALVTVRTQKRRGRVVGIIESDEDVDDAPSLSVHDTFPIRYSTSPVADTVTAAGAPSHELPHDVGDDYNNNDDDDDDDDLVVVTRRGGATPAARAPPTSSACDETPSGASPAAHEGTVRRRLQRAAPGKASDAASRGSSDGAASAEDVDADDDDGWLVDDDEEEEEGSDDDGATSGSSAPAPKERRRRRVRSSSNDEDEDGDDDSQSSGDSEGASEVEGPRHHSKASSETSHLVEGEPHPVTGRIVIHARASAHNGAGAAGRHPLLRVASKRDALTRALFREYNDSVFGGQLPLALPAVWSARLRKTAGLTYTQQWVVGGRDVPQPEYAGGTIAPSADGVVRGSRIELSVKVLESPSRLAATLLHEMCHAAAWLVDGVRKPPHGAAFKAWAAKASRKYPDRTVTTCHTYAITYRFRYACGGGGGASAAAAACGASWGRHSRSIDTTTARCGRCGGAIVLLPNDGAAKGHAATGARRAPAAPSAYVNFLKERRASTAAALGPSATPQAVMRAVAQRWTAHKAAAGQAASTVPSATSVVDLTSPDGEPTTVDDERCKHERDAVLSLADALGCVAME